VIGRRGADVIVLRAERALRTARVSQDHTTAAHLLRVTADDPEYVRQAAAEAAFWEQVHPLGLEAGEERYVEGAIEHYVNERFTGDRSTDWAATIPRWGTFRHGLFLGASSPRRERRVLETNPHVRMALVDISPGAVERRVGALAARFGDRITAAAGDLNFLVLPPERYDLVVSSSTIHHVTNLEHLAFQINRALTPDGFFFLEDYVGEPRFGFSPAKRRVFEMLYEREVSRQPRKKPGLAWIDGSDLSPFCGVRSDEILSVFREHLDQVQLRTAATLTVPMTRTRPLDFEHVLRNLPRWRILYAVLAKRLGVRERVTIDPRYLAELRLVGDVAADAGILQPGIAFAVYRKRRA
jgi:SAM-dependent methyltransferase